MSIGSYDQPRSRLGHHATGGLRLIIQRWPEFLDVSIERRMLFKRGLLKRMIDEFGLPQRYASDFLDRQYVATNPIRVLTSGSGATTALAEARRKGCSAMTQSESAVGLSSSI